MADIKYPEIEVQLSGTDGSTLALISTVSRAMRERVPPAKINEFRKEALSGDYDNVLRTCMRWVTVS